MKLKLFLVCMLVWINYKTFCQQPLDTAAYVHPIIHVTNPHIITSWAQFGQFDTSVVMAGTSLGGAYIHMQGTPTHHLVLINQGNGQVFMKGIEFDDCAYIDFLGIGSADAFGFFMDATQNGFAFVWNGKAHDITLKGMLINSGNNVITGQEGLASKIEAADLQSKYKCDMTYAHWADYNLTVKYCKFRWNGGESWYCNSTGWYGRDPVACPVNDTAIGNLGFDANHNPTVNLSKTLINTTTSTRNFKPYNGTPNTITETIVRNSGTVSGTITFRGSNDSVTYTTLATVTLTNVANNTYSQTFSGWQYYRVTVSTSGTMNFTESMSTGWLHSTETYQNIICDSNIFISPGRSGVNYSNIKDAEFFGNKGWHIGGELNTAQGKLLAAGGVDSLAVRYNRNFGSFHDAYWIQAQGIEIFTNNYNDSSGYYGTTPNAQLNPGVLFGTEVHRTAFAQTWIICSDSSYRTHGEGPGVNQTKEFGLYPGLHMTSTGNYFGSNNIGSFIIGNNNPFTYSTTCPNQINQPPVVNAGNNVILTLPTNSYTFQATAFDPENGPLTYLWTKISGPTFTINNATLLNPTVSNLLQGVYVFQFTATDNQGASASKNVQITVNNPPNKIPTCNAGSDITIQLPVNSATFSNAAVGDSDGVIVSTVWTQVSGGTYTIDNPNILHPTVSNLLQGTDVFKLTATDDSGATCSDNINVIIQQAVNKLPFVNAGPNVVITLPTNFYTFQAVASDSDGTIVTYLWTLVSGGTYTITSPNVLNPTVSNLQGGVAYVFRLTVTDDRGGKSSDNIRITVNNQPNIPPTVNAGRDTTLQLPNNTYQLVASASDPDGTITSYLWTQIAGTAATISNTAILNPLLTNLQLGVNKFSLKVTDNLGASSTDTITITIIAAANKPPVCFAGLPVTLTQPNNFYQTVATASDSDGVIVSYLWTQLSGGTFTISNASVLQPFISNLQTGVHVFQLTVTDNGGAKTSNNLTITVNNRPNIPPTVNAGTDANITLPINSYTVFNAIAVDTDGVIVSTIWTKASGGAATILNSNTLTPTFTGLVQGTYVFVLTATDDSSATGKDSMKVIVNHALNIPPQVNAGNDTTIQLPATTINLNGTASDADGVIVSTLWTNTDGCSITSATSLITTATCAAAGQHIFQLAATDDSSATSIDTKNVTVLTASNIPPVAIASNDTTVYLPTNSVTLHQSGTDADGTIVAYLSTIISSFYSPSIGNPTTQTPIIAGLSGGDTIKVQLRVTDNLGAFGFDTTTIIVKFDTTNHPPIVVVKRDTIASIRLPETQLVLNASQSYDPDSTDFVAAFSWVQTTGDTTLTTSSLNGSVLSLSGLIVGTYTFVLTITDSHGLTTSANIIITVSPALRFKITRSKVRR